MNVKCIISLYFVHVITAKFCDCLDAWTGSKGGRDLFCNREKHEIPIYLADFSTKFFRPHKIFSRSRAVPKIGSIFTTNFWER